jgi:hypothetical protein
MSNMLVPAVLTHLRQWAEAVRTDLGAAGVYVFGSLIHRDGTQLVWQITMTPSHCRKTSCGTPQWRST